MCPQIGIALVVLALAPGVALARDVGCGETCDTKMVECTAKCPDPTPGPDDPRSDAYVACWDECAKKTFHPCLDACKFPKPKWAKE